MHGTNIFTEDLEVIGIEPLSDYETERNKPMPNIVHSTIQGSIVFYMKSKFRDKYNIAPEASLNLSPGATPDVSIFEKRDINWRTVKAKSDQMPLTTIEIVSPSQSLDLMAQKVFNQYFPAGVQSAWIVVPPPLRAVFVFTPDGKRQIFDTGTITDPVTGVSIEVDEVFEGIY